MKYPKITIFILAAAMSTSTLVVANDDEEELQFEESYLFFELNDTDGDFGIHGKVDGDAWKWVAIEAPDERRIMYVLTRGGIRQQGLTELFFESAEPCFPTDEECEDPLDPDVFLARFPEGLYEWEGRTLGWEEIEGEVFLSHIIPAAPEVTRVGRDTNGDDNDECWEPNTSGGVTIRWDEVTHAHATLGKNTGQPLGDNEVLYYEFVAEIDGTEYKSTAILPPEVTSWRVPKRFINLARSIKVEDEDTGELVDVEEIKFEILVRVETGEHEDDDGETVDSRPGNKSAVEDTFCI